MGDCEQDIHVPTITELFSDADTHFLLVYFMTLIIFFNRFHRNILF